MHISSTSPGTARTTESCGSIGTRKQKTNSHDPSRSHSVAEVARLRVWLLPEVWRLRLQAIFLITGRLRAILPPACRRAAPDVAGRWQSGTPLSYRFRDAGRPSPVRPGEA